MEGLEGPTLASTPHSSPPHDLDPADSTPVGSPDHPEIHALPSDDDHDHDHHQEPELEPEPEQEQDQSGGPGVLTDDLKLKIIKQARQPFFFLSLSTLSYYETACWTLNP